MQPIVRINDDRIDELEAAMFWAATDKDSGIEFVDCPLNHYFFPKFYVREILMPANKLITSEVHKTCHLFEIIQGSVAVNIDNIEWATFNAFHQGTTLPNTRRVLYSWEDTVWRTYHPIDFITGEENELPYDEQMKIVDKIKDLIIEPYENKLIGGHVFLNKIVNNKKEIECLG